MADPGGATEDTGSPDQGPCGSCGWADQPVLAVRRVYLTLDRAGVVVDERVDDDVEHWCPACVATYPHRPA